MFRKYIAVQATDYIAVSTFWITQPNNQVINHDPWVHNRTKYAPYSTQKAAGEYSTKFLNKSELSLLNTLLQQSLRVGNLFIKTSKQSTWVFLTQRNTCPWITLDSFRYFWLCTENVLRMHGFPLRWDQFGGMLGTVVQKEQHSKSAIS